MAEMEMTEKEATKIVRSHLVGMCRWFQEKSEDEEVSESIQERVDDGDFSPEDAKVVQRMAEKELKEMENRLTQVM